eukprot:1160613-Pelagomonas_calceolata.AAC.4
MGLSAWSFMLGQSINNLSARMEIGSAGSADASCVFHQNCKHLCCCSESEKEQVSSAFQLTLISIIRQSLQTKRGSRASLAGRTDCVRDALIPPSFTHVPFILDYN